MEKRILLTIILLSLSIKTFSQENESKKFLFGINIGANLIDLDDSWFFEEHSGKVSYSLGVSAEFVINKRLSLISNINYDKKIMEWNITDYDIGIIEPSFSNVNDKLKLSYINIPVFLRYYLGKGKKFNINGGGFYNIALDVRNESIIDATGEEILLYQSENIIDNYDLGILLGISYKFELNNKNRFTLEFRNEFGLADISQIPEFVEVKTNTLKLILNWELPL